MLLLTHSDNAIGEHLAAELAGVESRFACELTSELACVNQLVAHIEQYRGKMLRPTLVLLAGMAGVGDEQELTEGHRVVATVVEMVHMATLVHDDILDEAQMRRRAATINHLQGNEAAVMLGDYLISHAYHLCSGLGSQEISRIIAGATNTVCEGELLQLANRGNFLLDEKTYFQIVRRKTASLCGTCCRLGALMHEDSGVNPQDLYTYGEKLGIAFQIVDDQLDLVGAEDTVGKTLGMDLQKGKLTLSLIHYMQSADRVDQKKLVSLLRLGDEGDSYGGWVPGGVLDPEQLAEVGRLMTGSGSVQYANEWATRLVEEAKGSLAGMDESPAKALLMEVADAVLTREY